MKQALLKLLKTGLSPAKLAQCVAFGVVLALCPVLGATTLLCLGAAWAFRLNIAAIQIVNYLAYPLQFLLLLPFYRAGEWLFREEPLALQPQELLARAKSAPWQFVADLWTVTWHAVVAWALIAPVLIALLSFLLVPVFERASRRMT